MRLVELDPQWIDRPREGRHGIGVDLRCLHCDQRLPLFFLNPVDGGPSKGTEGGPRWSRSGMNFDELTLSPSVKWDGHMHVSIQNGEVHQNT